MAGQRLAYKADGTCVNGVGGSSVGDTADGILQPTRLSQLAYQFAASVINRVHRLAIMRFLRQHTSGPEFQVCCQYPVPGLQKRPVQVTAVNHPQSPLNSGFCLAIKAWYARSKSLVAMQMACACASASMASSSAMFHSWCSIFLVIP